jgi:hypothetical protein
MSALAQALYNNTVRTVDRALKTKNSDTLLASAIKLHDLIQHLIGYDAKIRPCRKTILEHYRRQLEKIYHVHSPAHRGFNKFYYPPDSRTPDREPGFQDALLLLETALRQYHLACEEMAHDPESP